LHSQISTRGVYSSTRGFLQVSIARHMDYLWCPPGGRSTYLRCRLAPAGSARPTPGREPRTRTRTEFSLKLPRFSRPDRERHWEPKRRKNTFRKPHLKHIYKHGRAQARSSGHDDAKATIEPSAGSALAPCRCEAMGTQLCTRSRHARLFHIPTRRSPDSSARMCFRGLGPPLCPKADAMLPFCDKRVQHDRVLLQTERVVQSVVMFGFYEVQLVYRLVQKQMLLQSREKVGALLLPPLDL